MGTTAPCVQERVRLKCISRGGTWTGEHLSIFANGAVFFSAGRLLYGLASVRAGYPFVDVCFYSQCLRVTVCVCWCVLLVCAGYCSQIFLQS